jgi:hypothetical protein
MKCFFSLKKWLLMAVMYLSAITITQAQIANYTKNYSLQTGNTASLLLDRNNNPIDMSQGTALIPAFGFATQSPLTDIGFPFYPLQPNGPITQFAVNSYGLLAFFGANQSRLSANNVTAISAFNANMRVGSGGDISVLRYGNAPNRVLVVEWKNMQLELDNASPIGQATFQVRLYEADYVIEFVYGEMLAGVNTPTVPALVGYSRNSFGIASVTININTDTLARNASINNAFTANQPVAALHSTSNGNRKFYRIVPPARVATPTLGQVQVGAGSLRLTWPDLYDDEFGFVIRVGTDSTSMTTTNVNPNETQRTVNNLLPNTRYYYQFGVINGGGASFTPIDSFTTTNINTYTWVSPVADSLYNPNCWQPVRSQPDVLDRLVFNSGGTDTMYFATDDASRLRNHIGQIHIINNTTVRMISPVLSTLTFNGSSDTLPDFWVANGSTLYLGNGINQVGMQFNSNAAFRPVQGRINGVFGMNNFSTFSAFGDITAYTWEIYGQMLLTGNNVQTNMANTRVKAGAQVIRSLNLGTVNVFPQFIWEDNSSLTVNGITTSSGSISSFNQLYNLIWDCPSQLNTLEVSTLNVRNNLQINATGTGRLAVSGNIITKNLTLLGGELLLNNNLANVQRFVRIFGELQNTGGLISSNPGTNGFGSIDFADTTSTRQQVKLGNTSGPISYIFTGLGGLHITDSLPLRTNSRLILATNASPITTGTPISVSQTGQVTFQIGNNMTSVPTIQVPSSLLSIVGNGNHNLVINSFNGASLNGINNSKWAAITCQSGVLNLNTDTLILGTDAANPGNLNLMNGGFNNGTLRRWTPADLSAGAFEFPFVDNQRSRAISITPEVAGTNFSPAGFVSVTFTPNSGFFNIPLLQNGASASADRVSTKSWLVASDGQVGLSTGGRISVAATTDEVLQNDQLGHVLVKPANNNGIAGSANPLAGGLMQISRSFDSTTDLVGLFRAGLRAIPVNEWNGTGNWNQTANWSLGTLPTLNENARIASGTLTMIGSDPNKLVRNLFIDAGASLLIENNDAIRVLDSVFNQGSLRVNAGGSIVCDKGYGGTGTYEAVRTGSSSNLVYNYWSSPNSNTTMSQLGGQDWYRFDGPTQAWAAITGSTTLMPGGGYTATGAGQVVFTGRFNNGTIKVPVSAQGAGFNLIGNPYPSSLAAASFLFDNANSALTKTIYYWSQPQQASVGNSGGDYATWTILGGTAGSQGGAVPGNNIGLGQGFMVHASQTDSITMSVDMAQRDAGTNFRTVNAERIWINVTDNNGLFNQTLIGFSAAASDQKDEMDGLKFKGNYQIALYSLLGNEQLAIQALAERTQEVRTVALGFDAAAASTYTLSIDRLENIERDVYILLEDKHTNDIHNLRSGPYSFNTKLAGSFVDRFELHIGNHIATSVGPNNVLDRIQIYAAGNVLYIKGLDDLETERFNLRDATGRLVHNIVRPPADKLAEMPLSLAEGIYFVQLTTNQGIKTTKVYIGK